MVYCKLYTMIKKRLPSPYEFVWIDIDNMIHICSYLKCNDGCACEQARMNVTVIREIDRALRKFIKKQ